MQVDKVNDNIDMIAVFKGGKIKPLVIIWRGRGLKIFRWNRPGRSGRAKGSMCFLLYPMKGILFIKCIWIQGRGDGRWRRCFRSGFDIMYGREPRVKTHGSEFQSSRLKPAVGSGIR